MWSVVFHWDILTAVGLLHNAISKTPGGSDMNSNAWGAIYGVVRSRWIIEHSILNGAGIDYSEGLLLSQEC